MLVQYVLPVGPNAGVNRTAIVTAINEESKMANLTVFTDPGDGIEPFNGIARTESVPYSDEMKPGTWHNDPFTTIKVEPASVPVDQAEEI